MKFLVLGRDFQDVGAVPVDSFETAHRRAQECGGVVMAPVDNLMAALVEELKAHGEIYAARFVVKQWGLHPSLAPVPTGGSAAAPVEKGSSSTEFVFGQPAPEKPRSRRKK